MSQVVAKAYCNARTCTEEAYADLTATDGRVWRFCHVHVDLILRKLVDNGWKPLSEVLRADQRAT